MTEAQSKSSQNDTEKRRLQFLAAAAILISIAFAVLPLWDAIDRFKMLSALNGAFGMGGGKGAPFPPAGVGYPLAALALGFALYRGFQRSFPAGVGLYALGASVVLLYSVSTAIDTAITRSHAVDFWLICETNKSPLGRPGTTTPSRRSSFDGPHLDNGEPCTQQAEDRRKHLQENPQGDILDGLVQIQKRFPKDRARILWGSAAVLLMTTASGLLLRKARSPKP